MLQQGLLPLLVLLILELAPVTSHMLAQQNGSQLSHCLNGRA
jgi:hypothetical protein